MTQMGKTMLLYWKLINVFINVFIFSAMLQTKIHYEHKNKQPCLNQLWNDIGQYDNYNIWTK